ncbi:hypothetical protein GCM10018780_92110 [Streptomyces lanatus]|nr:hypothetical protein GCM10018780_92110 [Streptomyces lanatus]
MVGAEERVEAKVLGGLRHAEQGVVGGPLLGLGEDAKIHVSILHAATPLGRTGPPAPDGPGRVNSVNAAVAVTPGQ